MQREATPASLWPALWRPRSELEMLRSKFKALKSHGILRYLAGYYAKLPVSIKQNRDSNGQPVKLRLGQKERLKLLSYVRQKSRPKSHQLPKSS